MFIISVLFMIPQGKTSLCCRFMVGCEGCDGWFHPRCIGVTRATVNGWQSEGKDYICDECQSWPLIVLNIHYFFAEKKSPGNSKNSSSDASTSKQSRSRKKSRDESNKARQDGSEASDEENSNEHPAKTRREEKSSEPKGSSSRSRASRRRKPTSHEDFVTDEGDMAAALESVCRGALTAAHTNRSLNLEAVAAPKAASQAPRPPLYDTSCSGVLCVVLCCCCAVAVGGGASHTMLSWLVLAWVLPCPDIPGQVGAAAQGREWRPRELCVAVFAVGHVLRCQAEGPKKCAAMDCSKPAQEVWPLSCPF